MSLVIILGKFRKIKQCEKIGTMGFSGFVSGYKVKSIIVKNISEGVEKDTIYLVSLKGARIKDNSLSGELIKIKKLCEVNF